MTSRSYWLLGLLAACTSHGTSSGVRVDQEAPGANCEYGGVAVSSGADSNHNGTLDDSEITDIAYVCNGASPVACGSGSKIDGTVTIRDQIDLAPLTGVNCIDGDLIIAGTTLAAMPELQSLTTVTGGVVVAGNEALASLEDLSSLREIGLNYLIQGNDVLTSVGAISGLERVNGVAIVGNAALTDLAGLETITHLNYDLTITGNPALTSLQGLHNLETSSQTLNIRSNRTLSTLSALDKLRSIPVLDITGNAALTTFAPQMLERVDVRLLVNSNAMLQTANLPVLTTLADGIVFSNNPALASVSAPAMLVTGHFRVELSPSITTISAPQLGFATANVELSGVPQLASVDFTALTTIGGNLFISSAPALDDFTGFASLGSVGGKLWIQTSNGFTDFTGMSSLGTVAGDFIIASNAGVTSFAGLDALTNVDGNVSITNNADLSNAAAQAFVNSIIVKGSVTIN